MKNLVEVIAFAVALAAAPLAAFGRAKPNIVFILTDDLGYGDVGFTCNSRTNILARLRTPCLDRLSREGVVLTSHYAAAPVSAPSRASLITGRVQGKCSLRDNCFDRAFSETNTLASVLHGVGYATWAVGKWGVAGGGESGERVTSHPLDRGFDYFYGFLDHLAGHTYYHYNGRLNGAFMGITENRTDATPSAVGIYSTDLFVAKAKQLVSRHVAENGDRPFFLYLAMNTIHGSGRNDGTLAAKTPLHVPGRPYPPGGVSWPLAPEPLESRNTWIDPAYRGLPEPAARYATAISRLDTALSDFFGELALLGLDRNTMVVFTSDNGPADEYGADPRFFGSNGPFDGLKRDVFEGGMRVPTFVRWPAQIDGGQTDNSPSQFHDWMATLADAAGATAPVETEGVSLIPRWSGRNAMQAKQSLVYSQYEFPWNGASEAFREFASRKAPVRGLQQMLRVGDYVALRTRIREGNAKTRLYNVVEDPFQANDLSGLAEHAERLRAMERTLDDRLCK